MIGKNSRKIIAMVLVAMMFFQVATPSLSLAAASVDFENKEGILTRKVGEIKNWAKNLLAEGDTEGQYYSVDVNIENRDNPVKFGEKISTTIGFTWNDKNSKIKEVKTIIDIVDENGEISNLGRIEGASNVNEPTDLKKAENKIEHTFPKNIQSGTKKDIIVKTTPSGEAIDGGSYYIRVRVFINEKEEASKTIIGKEITISPLEGEDKDKYGYVEFNDDGTVKEDTYNWGFIHGTENEEISDNKHMNFKVFKGGSATNWTRFGRDKTSENRRGFRNLRIVYKYDDEASKERITLYTRFRGSTRVSPENYVLYPKIDSYGNTKTLTFGEVNGAMLDWIRFNGANKALETDKVGDKFGATITIQEGGKFENGKEIFRDVDKLRIDLEVKESEYRVDYTPRLNREEGTESEVNTEGEFIYHHNINIIGPDIVIDEKNPDEGVRNIRLEIPIPEGISLQSIYGGIESDLSNKDGSSYKKLQIKEIKLLDGEDKEIKDIIKKDTARKMKDGESFPDVSDNNKNKNFEEGFTRYDGGYKWNITDEVKAKDIRKVVLEFTDTGKNNFYRHNDIIFKFKKDKSGDIKIEPAKLTYENKKPIKEQEGQTEIVRREELTIKDYVNEGNSINMYSKFKTGQKDLASIEIAPNSKFQLDQAISVSKGKMKNPFIYLKLPKGVDVRIEKDSTIGERNSIQNPWTDLEYLDFPLYGKHNNIKGLDKGEFQKIPYDDDYNLYVVYGKTDLRNLDNEEMLRVIMNLEFKNVLGGQHNIEYGLGFFDGSSGEAIPNGEKNGYEYVKEDDDNIKTRLGELFKERSINLSLYKKKETINVISTSSVTPKFSYRVGNGDFIEAGGKDSLKITPGGQVEYKIDIENTGSTKINKLEFINILPNKNDGRGSLYNLTLALNDNNSPDISLEKGGKTLGETPHTSDSYNPKRFDKDGNNIGEGEWTQEPRDPKDIKSIKVVLTEDLLPSEVVSLKYKLNVPIDAPRPTETDKENKEAGNNLSFKYTAGEKVNTGFSNIVKVKTTEQTEKGEISGIVKVGDVPAANINFNLYKKDTEGKYQIVKGEDGNNKLSQSTDEGKFGFTDLQTGTYRISLGELPEGYVHIQDKIEEIDGIKFIKVGEGVSEFEITDESPNCKIEYLLGTIASIRGTVQFTKNTDKGEPITPTEENKLIGKMDDISIRLDEIENLDPIKPNEDGRYFINLEEYINNQPNEEAEISLSVDIENNNGQLILSSDKNSDGKVKVEKEKITNHNIYITKNKKPQITIDIKGGENNFTGSKIKVEDDFLNLEKTSVKIDGKELQDIGSIASENGLDISSNLNTKQSPIKIEVVAEDIFGNKSEKTETIYLKNPDGEDGDSDNPGTLAMKIAGFTKKTQNYYTFDQFVEDSGLQVFEGTEKIVLYDSGDNKNINIKNTDTGKEIALKNLLKDAGTKRVRVEYLKDVEIEKDGKIEKDKKIEIMSDILVEVVARDNGDEDPTTEENPEDPNNPATDKVEYMLTASKELKKKVQESYNMADFIKDTKLKVRKLVDGEEKEAKKPEENQITLYGVGEDSSLGEKIEVKDLLRDANSNKDIFIQYKEKDEVTTTIRTKINLIVEAGDYSLEADDLKAYVGDYTKADIIRMFGIKIKDNNEDKYLDFEEGDIDFFKKDENEPLGDTELIDLFTKEQKNIELTIKYKPKNESDYKLFKDVKLDVLANEDGTDSEGNPIKENRIEAKDFRAKREYNLEKSNLINKSELKVYVANELVKDLDENKLKFYKANSLKELTYGEFLKDLLGSSNSVEIKVLYNDGENPVIYGGFKITESTTNPGNPDDRQLKVRKKIRVSPEKEFEKLDLVNALNVRVEKANGDLIDGFDSGKIVFKEMKDGAENSFGYPKAFGVNTELMTRYEELSDDSKVEVIADETLRSLKLTANDLKTYAGAYTKADALRMFEVKVEDNGGEVDYEPKDINFYEGDRLVDISEILKEETTTPKKIKISYEKENAEEEYIQGVFAVVDLDVLENEDLTGEDLPGGDGDGDKPTDQDGKPIKENRIEARDFTANKGEVKTKDNLRDRIGLKVFIDKNEVKDLEANNIKFYEGLKVLGDTEIAKIFDKIFVDREFTVTYNHEGKILTKTFKASVKPSKFEAKIYAESFGLEKDTSLDFSNFKTKSSLRIDIKEAGETDFKPYNYKEHEFRFVANMVEEFVDSLRLEKLDDLRMLLEEVEAEFGGSKLLDLGETTSRSRELSPRNEDDRLITVNDLIDNFDRITQELELEAIQNLIDQVEKILADRDTDKDIEEELENPVEDLEDAEEAEETEELENPVEDLEDAEEAEETEELEKPAEDLEDAEEAEETEELEKPAEDLEDAEETEELEIERLEEKPIIEEVEDRDEISYILNQAVSIASLSHPEKMLLSMARTGGLGEELDFKDLSNLLLGLGAGKYELDIIHPQFDIATRTTVVINADGSIEVTKAYTISISNKSISFDDGFSRDMKAYLPTIDEDGKLINNGIGMEVVETNNEEEVEDFTGHKLEIKMEIDGKTYDDYDDINDAVNKLRVGSHEARIDITIKDEASNVILDNLQDKISIVVKAKPVVTFVKDDEETRVSVRKGETIDKDRVPETSKSGYTFLGWKTSPDGSGESFDLASPIYSDMTLYASYRREGGGSGGSGGGSGGGNTDNDKDDNNDDDKDKPGENQDQNQDQDQNKPNDNIVPQKPSTPEENDKVDRYKGGDRSEREDLIGMVIEEQIEYELNKTDHLAYLKGYNDNTVRPEGNVTREEAAMVFYRLMEPEFRKEVETEDQDFTDVEKGRWSEKAIATLANAEMITGYKDGSFKPTKEITRAEVSSMIGKLTDTVILPTEFTDVVEHWAEDYINSVERQGWIKGYEDGSFKPNALIKRSEFVTIVNSILERQVKKENILEGIRVFKDLEENKWYYEQVIEASNGHKYVIKDGEEVWTELDNREFE